MVSEIFTLNASLEQDLASNTPVFNQSQIEDVLYVKVPYAVCQLNRLIELAEVPVTKDLTELEPILDHITFLRYRPWVDIESTLLNLEPGHHKYKLKFKNIYTSVISNLFFAYDIQCDDPEKPYIYMNKEAT